MTKKRKINMFIPIAILAGIALAIFTSSKPFKVYQQEKSKADDMRNELNGLQKSNLKLKEKDQLLSPIQKEEEARRLGYVRPEEHTLQEKPSTETPSTVDTKKSSKKESSDEPIDLHGNEPASNNDLR